MHIVTSTTIPIFATEFFFNGLWSKCFLLGSVIGLSVLIDFKIQAKSSIIGFIILKSNFKYVVIGSII